MQSTQSSPETPAKRDREKILVLLHHDGFVEVYGNKSVDCHITNVPLATTQAGQILAQEFLDLSIPRPYREVYFPSYCRATELLRPTRASDIITRRHDVELLREIQNRKGGYKR